MTKREHSNTHLQYNYDGRVLACKLYNTSFIFPTVTSARRLRQAQRWLYYVPLVYRLKQDPSFLLHWVFGVIEESTSCFSGEPKVVWQAAYVWS